MTRPQRLALDAATLVEQWREFSEDPLYGVGQVRNYVLEWGTIFQCYVGTHEAGLHLHFRLRTVGINAVDSHRHYLCAYFERTTQARVSGARVGEFEEVGVDKRSGVEGQKRDVNTTVFV